jgi:replicative DNA helicase
MQDLFNDYIPVHSREAEMCVLGSMMLSDLAIPEVSQILSAEDFYQQAHRTMFQVIQSLSAKGSAVDLVTVRNALQEQGKLEICGGVPTLVMIAESTASPKNAKEYAEIVKEKSLMRSLESAGQEIIRLSRDPELEIDQRIDKALQTVGGVSNGRAGALKPSMAHEVSADLMDEIDRMYDGEAPEQGRMTTFQSLDMKTGGIHPGEYWLIGARPGQGKTAMLVSMAIGMAKAGERILIITIEMTSKDLIRRMISQRSGLTINTIRSKPNSDSYERIRGAHEDLRKLPIEIIDMASPTIESIAAYVRSLTESNKPDVIMLAYVKLVRTSDTTVRSDTDRMTVVSSGLRELAKSTQIPIIALAQLRRADPTQPDKKPTLQDFKATSQFEQDVHVAIFLHRVMDDPSPTGQMELIIAKNRSGETGSVYLGFHKATTKVANLR